MSKFTKTGNWYVDSYYGNDTTGTGTAANPFQTMLRAHTAASTGHRVICTGIFSDPIPNSKSLHWEGEGICVVDGSNLANGSILFYSNSYGSVTGFEFRFFQGASFALYPNEASRPVVNCTFIFCNNLSRCFNFIGCILFETVLENGGGSTTTPVVFDKCTLINCRGNINITGGFIFRSNIFHLCSNMVIPFPTSRPANSEFNYNNITGTLNAKTNADWQNFGDGQYQASGHALSVSDIFNDYSAGRDSTNYWQNDFTMKPTCILKDAAKDGLEIGAKRIGYRFTAADLWNTYLESETNLDYSAANGLMLLDPGQGSGTYTSTWIQLPANIQFDILNLFAAFVFSGSTPVQYIDQNGNPAPDSGVNQRWSYDADFAYANTDANAPAWKKMEFNRRIRIDGSGNGVADDAYNVASEQIPAGSWFKIRFTLRNTAA